MKKIEKIIIKYKEIINYLIFGVATTVVSIVSYFIFAKTFNINPIISNIISWVISVFFAYITNRKYVFESKTTGKKEIIKEMISFFSCRIFSGIIDTSIFTVMVEILKINDGIAKIVTQVIVIILNYVLSKLVTFRKKENDK